MDWLDQVQWPPEGLVAAIAQDVATGKVLTLAWMNREALTRTAKEGAALYVQKGCAACHGAAGSGAHAPTLVSRGKGPHAPPSAPCLAPCVNDANTMGLHSPFATVIWDYINRGMPLGKEGSLTPNEVYSLTAFLLFKHDVIKEDEVMDAKSLPKVKMPNREGFALPTPWKPGEPRLQGYP